MFDFKADLQNSKNIEINILGSCILRDAWGVGKEFGDYKILNFFQSQSLYSLNTAPLNFITDEKINKEDMALTPNSWFEWTLVNSKKNCFELLRENKGNFLIVGLTEILDATIKLENKKDFVYLDYNLGIKKNSVFELEKFKGLQKTIVPYEEIIKNGSFFDESLEKFENEILSIYDPNHIIFVDVYPAKRYLTKTGEFQYFNNAFDKNIFSTLNYAYNHFINKIKPYVVKVPLNSIADENHKWGLSFWHYEQTVYDYLKTCFTLIMKDIPELGSKLDSLERELEFHNEELLKREYDYIKFKNFNLNSEMVTFLIARIDLKNCGDKSNQIEILNCSDNKANISNPIWFANKDGKGTIIHSSAQKLNLTIKCLNESNSVFTVLLRTKDIRDSNKKRIPIFVKYLKLAINGEVIFDKEKIISHDTPFKYEKKVNNGEIINIHLEWTNI